MTEAEAAETWGKESIEQLYYRLSSDNERRYVAGLDVLHTLHCLNMLRMKLDLDYYPAAAIGSLHNYHCIDQIRQYLMCTGDLTPIPVRWHEALGRPYVDSDKPHTCRNFSALQSWVMNRDRFLHFPWCQTRSVRNEVNARHYPKCTSINLEGSNFDSYFSKISHGDLECFVL